MDLSKLSDKDLEALYKNDLSSVSDEGLAYLHQAHKSESDKSISYGSPQISEEETYNAILRGQRPASVSTSPSGSSIAGGPPVTLQAGRDFLPEEVRTDLATGAKYGIPIAAMVATAPASVPAGIGATLLEMGKQSLIGGASAYASSLAANAIEGSNLNQKEAAINALSFATPSYARGAGMSLAPWIAGNAALAVGGNELVNYVEKGKFEKPEGYREWLNRSIPATFVATIGVLQHGGRGLKNVDVAKKAISEERAGGSVMAHEIAPGFKEYITKLEANQLANGNAKVVELYKNTGANIGDAVKQAFADVKNGNEIANNLAPLVGKIDELEKASIVASKNAEDLSKQATAAAESFSIDAPKIKEAARDAALTAYAAKAQHEAMLKVAFGSGVPSVTGVSLGQRSANLVEASEAAKSSVKKIIDNLYTEAGIGIDTPVVSRSDVDAFSSSIKGKDAQADFKKSMDAVFGGEPTITRERYLNAKDRIFAAYENADTGMKRRVAAQAMDVLKKASESYIKTNLPENYLTYAHANKAYASVTQAMSTDVVDAIASGNADAVYDMIKRSGAKGPLEEIGNYVSAIKSVAGEAAANKFAGDINAGLRDALFDRAKIGDKGFVSAGSVFDPKVIAREASVLANKGFPIESLGIGDKKQLLAMAKIGSLGERGGLLMSEVAALLDEVPKVGIDKAIAKVEYNKMLAKQLTLGGYFKKYDNVKQLEALSKKAGMDSVDAQIALSNARNNPLYVLLNDTSLGINKDMAKNTEWANNLLSYDKDYIGKFAEAMRATGRGQQLAEIGKAAAKSKIMQFEQALTSGKSTLDTAKTADFFFGGANKAYVENLEQLMGKDEYANFVKNFVKPIERLNIVKEKMTNVSKADVLNYQVGAIAAGAIQNKTTGGVVLGNAINRMVQFAKNRQYGLIYTLFVDPKWSTKFAETGYNLDKFIAKSPVNAVAVQLAQEDDRLSNQ